MMPSSPSSSHGCCSCKTGSDGSNSCTKDPSSSTVTSSQRSNGTVIATKGGWYRKDSTSSSPPPDIFEDYNETTGGLDNDKAAEFLKNSDGTAENDPWTYYGDRLTALEFPLGGFGTGQILFQGDGSLQGFTIQNNFHSQEYTPLYQLPGNMFGIQAKYTDDSRPAQNYVLQTPQNYTKSNRNVTDAQIRRLQNLPGIRSLQAKCQYPIATIDYDIPGFPLKVQLECMTPLIPGNTKDSSLPLAVFTFTVENTTSKSVEVSLLQTALNLVGWDGKTSVINDNVETPFWEGNVNTPLNKDSAYAGWSMTSTSTPKCPCNNDPTHQDGSISLVAISNSNNTQPGLIVKSSKSEIYLWQDFCDGNVYNPSKTKTTDPSFKGLTYIGGVTQNLMLSPNGKQSCQFVLAWHFPNKPSYVPRYNLPSILGNQYQNWFESSDDVIEYFVTNSDRLLNTTRKYVQTMYSTTIPFELLESAAGRLSVLRCPSMFWTKDGTVLFNEGNDCCALNCTHVIGYTFLLERLYPDLAKNLLKSNFITNFDPDHGCSMRFGEGGFAIDGSLACVIKVYLVVIQGDSKLEFLKQVWPNVKKQIGICMDQADMEYDCVIRCLQQNTYDRAMQGANTFIGSYWITALKATTIMANLMKDFDFADLCDKTWKTAVVAYEQICWKEEYQYYIADVDENTATNSYGPGCFIDQLSAVGLSLAAGFGSVFNPDNEAVARRSIFQNNSVQKPPFQDLQKHFYDGDKGVRCATYPHGSLPGCYVYDDLVSIGFSYPVIAAMIHDGGENKNLALEWARNIRNRHSGVNRSPWNEPECGLLYTRGMASWGLYEQACGLHYDSTKASLRYAPKFNETNFSCFAIVEGGWGKIRHTWRDDRGRIEIECQYGSMKLESISTPHLRHVVDIPKHKVLSATIRGKSLDDVTNISSEGMLRLPSILEIKSGDTLVVVLSNKGSIGGNRSTKESIALSKNCRPKLFGMILLLLVFVTFIWSWMFLDCDTPAPLTRYY